MTPKDRQKIGHRAKATAMPVMGDTPAGKLISQLREDARTLLKELAAAESREQLYKGRSEVLKYRLDRKDV